MIDIRIDAELWNETNEDWETSKLILIEEGSVTFEIGGLAYSIDMDEFLRAHEILKEIRK